jgi:transcriptional regulator with XRE-family HTH domain
MMPHPVDIHVGDRLRFKRKFLGLSQTEFGNGLGLSFQQVQKYETGANRISASRLFRAASFLGEPVSFFFEEMPPEITGPDGPSIDAPTVDLETGRFLKAYCSVQDRQVRDGIRGLLQQLATEPEST